MKEAKKLWSWLAIPCIALAVLTGSILPVLLVRGFYTAQIGPLGICEASGLTGQQAAEACGPSRRRAPATLPTCGGCSGG